MHAQNASNHLHAKIGIFGPAHGNHGKGARRVESQRHSHFEQQDFLAFVQRHRQQIIVGFVGGIPGDHVFRHAQFQQTGFGFLNGGCAGVAFVADLYQHQGREVDANFCQLLFNRVVGLPAFRQCGCGNVAQGFLVIRSQIGDALHTALNQASVHGILARNPMSV